jgi:hypothetical protein
MIKEVAARRIPSASEGLDSGDPPTVVRVSRTNGRGWSMEPFVFEIRPATVVVVDNERVVAGIQRAALCSWLKADAPDPFEDAGTVWTRRPDDIRVSIGRAVYTIPSGSEVFLVSSL